MKTLFLAIALLFAAPALAGEDYTKMMSVADQAQPMGSGYDCYAYTACPRGGMIACHVYGVSSTGSQCSWWVQPYAAVHCEGVDGYGTWQTYTFVCP